MNTLKKLAVLSVGIFAVGLTGCGRTASEAGSVGKLAANVYSMTTQISAFSVELGMLTAEVGAVTAEIARTIAYDVLAQLRGREGSGTSADVEAAVFAGGVIETVVVEAPRIETVVVEASRLPPQNDREVVRTAQARF